MQLMRNPRKSPRERFGIAVVCDIVALNCLCVGLKVQLRMPITGIMRNDHRLRRILNCLGFRELNFSFNFCTNCFEHLPYTMVHGQGRVIIWEK